MIDRSLIQANALAGFGGRVTIVADNILVPGGDFEALLARGDISATGGDPTRAGTVVVSAPEVDLASGLVVLEGALLDAASQLRERCGARRDVGASSFTGAGRGGLPPSPDGPLASAYVVGEAAVGEQRKAGSGREQGRRRWMSGPRVGSHPVRLWIEPMRFLHAAVCLLAAGAMPASADVVTDGTVGPKDRLEGDIEIGADLGTRAGRQPVPQLREVRHRTGETATFTGPDAIRNVISRVTGGEVSAIDGTLAPGSGRPTSTSSTRPASCSGRTPASTCRARSTSSTADELRFADGARFSALDKTGSGLTVAPPEAFGFLDKPPGRITVDRSRWRSRPARRSPSSAATSRSTAATAAASLGASRPQAEW